MSWRRLLATGLVAAALAGLAGGTYERWWLGPTDATAAARVEAIVRNEFDAMTAALGEVAGGIAQDRAAEPGLAGGPDAARVLFDLVSNVRSRSPHPDDIAVTVYDYTGVARAWSGRPSDIPGDRIVGPRDLFVMQSELGLRLIRIEPITTGDARRLGAVAVEHVLSRLAAGAAIAPANYSLPTPIAPVSLRLHYERSGPDSRDGAFLLRTPGGAPLVEASVATSDLQQTREQWRRTIVAVLVTIVGVTVLLLIGPVLDRRMRTSDPRTAAYQTAITSGFLLVGSAAVWAGVAIPAGGVPRIPVNIAFCGVTLAALAALWAGPVTRLRLAFRSARPMPQEARGRFIAIQLLAGAVVAVCIILFTGVLEFVVDPATIDLRHFSLYPGNAARIVLIVGILALHVAALWIATLILIASRAAWNLPRGWIGDRVLLLILWVVPTGALAAAALARGWQVPASAVLLSSTACGLAALMATRVVTWYRHATVAARIFALFLSFLVPAVLLYPSLDYFAELATQRLITTRYAVEAQNHSQSLQERMSEARKEVDAFPGLPDLVSDTSDGQPVQPSTGRAFLVWSQTALARERLTSAVELYGRNGQQVSRFALNLPEYTGGGPPPQSATGCTWDVYAEPLPIGSEQRNVLHAERSICIGGANGTPPEAVGTVILHVASDYRTLPFITSQSPYFEVFRPTQPGASTANTAGGDVSVVIYGWGLQPVYTSGLSAWPITDALFQRIYDPARTPFWTAIRQGGETYRVYFSNDRARIYALGYTMLTIFDHLVHLAEVTTLAGAAFIVVLLGTALFTRISRERPRVGRALLREIRASFYRKLFLAFVLASIIPVLTLALVIRTYFADLLRDDIQAEAARTAAVAQRVIEESDALLRRGAEGVGPLNDDVMVWISQVIDQDVNIFAGPELRRDERARSLRVRPAADAHAG